MDNLQVANTIIQQLAGHLGRLKIMIGAYNFVGGHNFVAFKFKAGTKYNYCKITLNSLDLYDMEISKIRAHKEVRKFELDGMYWDMLKPVFEKETGLALSL